MGEIVFHAGSKLSWLESIARDRETTAFDVRVAIAISNRTKGDGTARQASQQWIARYIGATERGVRKSIAHLSSLGYLEPTRNPLGDGKDGRPAFGGNRHATEYRLSKRETRNGGSGLGEETRNRETRNGEAANPERRSSEPGTAVPFLSYISNKQSFAHARAHAREIDTATKWQGVKECLAHALGRDVFESWFSKVALVHFADGVVTMRPPSKFAARWLTDKYHDHVLEVWRSIEPNIVDVRFDHTAIAASEISSRADVSSGEVSR